MTLNELIKQGNDAIDNWDWHNAYQSWENVLELEPDNAWAKVKLGRILFEMHQYDRAERLLTEDAEDHPERPYALIHLAKISQMRNDWEEAGRRWEYLFSKFPDNEWALLPYAQTLKELEKFNKAERYCQMEIDIHPGSTEGYLLHIEIALEKGQFKLARQRIDRYISRFPKQASALDRYENRLDEAINQLQLSDYANFTTLPELKYRFLCKNQQRYIYVEVPKAGSSSVVANLYRVAHGETADAEISRNDMANALRYPERGNDKQFENHLRSALILDDHFIFTFVRNPYTRILSGFLNKIDHPSDESRGRRAALGFQEHDIEDVSFFRFLMRLREADIDTLDIHFRPQWHLLGLNKSIKYDFIGHLESFETDLHYVLRRIGGDHSLPDGLVAWRGHATNAKDQLLQFYGPEEQALVAEIYEDDFKYLGYGFDLVL